MDAICLTGMSFYGFHGVHPEERVLGQRFVVDVRLELNLDAAGRGDDLSASVDYARVWETTRRIVEGPPSALLERVGWQIGEALLADFALVDRVWVRVAKPSAPIPGASFASIAVEMTRERQPRAVYDGADGR